MIRFDAYAPGGTPNVAAKLLNRAGQAMVDVPVSTQAAGATHQIDLPLASMAPGEYLVEINGNERGRRRQAAGRVPPGQLIPGEVRRAAPSRRPEPAQFALSLESEA